LLLALVLEGEGIAAHVLQDLAHRASVRTEIERLLAAGTEGEAGAELGLPVYLVGERVLVHDATHRFDSGKGESQRLEKRATKSRSLPPCWRVVKTNSTRIHAPSQ